MKKIIFLLLFIPSLVFSQTFIVDTSRGPQRVEIPEGYTATEAFREMAVLYLEERYDLEEALEIIDNLTSEVEEYIKLVDRLQEEVDTLQRENEEYQVLLEDEMKPDFVKYVGSAGLGLTETSYYGTASFGLQFLESWFATIDASVPLRLGFSIGRTF